MDVIVDIDGTLADCKHRLPHIQKRPKDWDAFFAAVAEDVGIWPVIDMVEALHRNRHRVVFCTGRPASTRDATVRWLGRHFSFPLLWLYTRRDGDHRDDDIVKREMLELIRSDGFNPVLAIEDRARVVKMWRDEGLICAQVASGDF